MKKDNSNKTKRTEIKKTQVIESQKGLGLFLFKNRNKEASLQLPKISFDGKRWVGPNETWQGDSFFLKMIPKEAILVETLLSPNEEKQKENNMEERLILDQPDQITNDGKIEHVVSSQDIVEINENTKKRKKRNKNESNLETNKLLTEDPIAGVTIIRD